MRFSDDLIVIDSLYHFAVFRLAFYLLCLYTLVFADGIRFSDVYSASVILAVPFLDLAGRPNS